MYAAHVYNDMGVWGLFSVRISSEKADKDLISGDVYRKTCLAGQLFVRMSSVQRDTGHWQCTTEVMDANGVQGGGVFGNVPLNLLKISLLNKYPW